jgi:hypothetical protein
MDSFLVDRFADEDEFLATVAPVADEVGFDGFDDVFVDWPVLCFTCQSLMKGNGVKGVPRATIANQGPPPWRVSMLPA